MKRKKIVIGNWKMNPLSDEEAKSIFSSINKLLYKLNQTSVVICPPSLFLISFKNKLNPLISLGSQNVFEENPSLGIGAYTGEISASMLKNSGVKYSIVGHSERRINGETNEEINKKIKLLLDAKIIPILCIGEKERDTNHDYFNYIKNQIEKALEKIKKEDIEKIIIAYEPVWAISTTKNKKTANPSDFKEMYIYIKKIIANKYGTKLKIPQIIYGGSVNSKNAEGFLTEGGADGLLVGKESLNPRNFSEIVKIAENIK
ncbi:MAG: triose-phosphate isomerase [Candidatus Paceibacterota bacterium]|jgi:triosephosphate isomerase